MHNPKARSEDTIRRKILEKVGTFTTHPGFKVLDEEDIEENNDSMDPDLVVTTASDTDSSGDSKIVASSVDGEDDVVDVTMKDSNSIRESVEKGTDKSIPSKSQDT
jgi:ubiquitin carboxyl-terminal hydrolase 4/11/15